MLGLNWPGLFLKRLNPFLFYFVSFCLFSPLLALGYALFLDHFTKQPGTQHFKNDVRKSDDDDYFSLELCLMLA